MIVIIDLHKPSSVLSFPHLSSTSTHFCFTVLPISSIFSNLQPKLFFFFCLSCPNKNMALFLYRPVLPFFVFIIIFHSFVLCLTFFALFVCLKHLLYFFSALINPSCSLYMAACLYNIHLKMNLAHIYIYIV